MATQQELDQINDIVATRGFAFLTSGQKQILQESQTQAPSIPSAIEPVKEPVVSLSSEQGQNIFNKNLETLNKLEGGIVGSQGPQLATEEEINQLGKGGVVTRDGQQFRINPAGELVALQASTGPVQLTGSPASDKIASEINNVISNIGLTKEQQDNINAIQTQQDRITAETAAAREAADKNDFLSMDAAIKRAEEEKTRLQDDLASLFKEIAPLRQQLTQTLTPTEKEKQLSQQLIDLRTAAKQFEIDTQRDKLAEFKGQTQRFAVGRAKEIDLKASFVRQETALKEQNLLLSLGLEQKSREMQALSIEQQLNFIEQDFELRQAIEDRLDEKENIIIEKVQAIKEENRALLSDILTSLEGINPEELSSEVTKQIKELSDSVGMPFEILEEALKVQFERQVFEDSIEQKENGRKSNVTGVDNSVFITPEGEEIDVSTVGGIKELANKGFGYAEIFSFLDENTKLTSTSIKGLLTEAGLREDDPTFELSNENIINLFSNISQEEKLKAIGKTREEFTEFFKGKKSEEKEIDKQYLEYLNDIVIPSVEARRKLGQTDMEIAKAMGII